MDNPIQYPQVINESYTCDQPNQLSGICALSKWNSISISFVAPLLRHVVACRFISHLMDARFNPAYYPELLLERHRLIHLTGNEARSPSDSFNWCVTNQFHQLEYLICVVGVIPSGSISTTVD